jgi:hypothetical protein
LIKGQVYFIKLKLSENQVFEVNKKSDFLAVFEIEIYNSL